MNAQLPANVLTEVAAFLGESPLPGVIGGKMAMASNGETFCTRDPGSGQPLAEVAAMSADDVDRAVKAAQHAFDTSDWRRLKPNERGVLLHRLADAVERRKNIIAQIEALDAGKILAQAEGDVQNFVESLRYYTTWRFTPSAAARWPSRATRRGRSRQPWGPCGFIFPWNFPFLLMGWNISPALAAGNTVVIKPAEDTPLSTHLSGAAGERGRHPRRRDQRRARLRHPRRRGVGRTSGPPAACRLPVRPR